jgi:hypothetical protein
MLWFFLFSCVYYVDLVASYCLTITRCQVLIISLVNMVSCIRFSFEAEAKESTIIHCSIDVR